jgi:hypothetical protein
MTNSSEVRKIREKLPSAPLSLDTWAVLLALGLSLLIWIGIIKHVPW